MTVKEAMLKLLADAEANDDSPDIDFCDDYDESAWCAYCGNHWSQKAEEMFAVAFNLEVYEMRPDDDCVLVKCHNRKEVNALHDLLYAMAGYIADDEYQELFPEPEEESEQEPVRNPVAVVTITGAVIKAKMVEIVQHQMPGLRIVDMDDHEEVVPVDQIVRIIGEE